MREPRECVEYNDQAFQYSGKGRHTVWLIKLVSMTACTKAWYEDRHYPTPNAASKDTLAILRRAVVATGPSLLQHDCMNS